MWLPRSCLVVVLASIGCGKGGGDKPPDECAPIRTDPTKAIADLGKRLPPVEVAKTIERCVAPTGDECERVAALVRAIPSFVPTLGPTPDNALATCRDAPAELRRCLLPSYVLEHKDECAALLDKLRDTAISTIEVTPQGGSGGGGSGAGTCKPVDVAIEVSPAGVKVKPAYSAAWNGPLAADTLGAELANSVSECPGRADITATADATYQQVVDAMDAATKVGLAPGFDAGKSAKPAAPAPPPADKAALQKAPVVVVTKTEVTLGGTVVAPRDGDKLAGALAAALRAQQKAQPGSLLILQADKDTPGRVLDVIVTTANAAGYDNLMFAVKNR